MFLSSLNFGSILGASSRGIRRSRRLAARSQSLAISGYGLISKGRGSFLYSMFPTIYSEPVGINSAISQ
jgi:hypothetical protein